MAIAYRASAEAYNASTNTLTCNKPAGTLDGDVMLAFAYCNAPSDIITAPAGWTVVQTINTTITARMTVYYKVALGEGADYTFTFDNTQRSRLTIHSFSGCSATSPINASAVTVTSTSTSVVSPSITTTVADCVLVRLVASDNTQTIAYGVPDGMTQVFDSGTVASGMEVSTLAIASAGATGEKTGTSDYSTTSVGFSVALNPTAATAGDIMTLNSGFWGGGGSAVVGQAWTSYTSSPVTNEDFPYQLILYGTLQTKTFLICATDILYMTNPYTSTYNYTMHCNGEINFRLYEYVDNAWVNMTEVGTLNYYNSANSSRNYTNSGLKECNNIIYKQSNLVTVYMAKSTP